MRTIDLKVVYTPMTQYAYESLKITSVSPHYVFMIYSWMQDRDDMDNYCSLMECFEMVRPEDKENNVKLLIDALHRLGFTVKVTKLDEEIYESKVTI